MIYAKILGDIYKENRREIRFYITFALMLSIFIFDNGVVYATNSIETAEAMIALGGQGGLFLAPIAKAGLINFDVSSGLAIVSLVSILFDLIPLEILVNLGVPKWLVESSFGLLDARPIQILCFVWFIAEKLPRTTRISYSMGVVLEYIETKCGIWIEALVVLSEYFTNFSTGMTVQASSISEKMFTVNTSTTIFNAFDCFIILISLLIIYIFTRTFFFFISIALIPLCTIVPFSSILVEAFKVGIIIFLGSTALLSPQLFFIIYAFILLISILFFKRAYITVRYFKNIYVKPFFKKLKKHNDIALIYNKYPSKLHKQIENENVSILIPVYLMKKIPQCKSCHRHERWWFVSAESKQYICKPRFINSSCYIIDLKHSDSKKIFIHQAHRFIEIFTITNEKDIGKKFNRIHKNIHIVFSKEYIHQFESIKEITEFYDYAEYCKKMKEAQKLLLMERRRERKLRRFMKKHDTS